ncbi:MAG: twin-arginine translocase TatA/TatE family subunit [Bdellovibrio sp.]|nr:twin-arginine translocase TatA/TatE family subunit [Bdellovibrio sp.]
MFGLGMGELVIITFIVVLLFGGSKLPQLGGALGKAMTNFKKGLRDGNEDQNLLTGQGSLQESPQKSPKIENEKSKKVFEV